MTYALTLHGEERFRGSIGECIKQLVDLAPGEVVHKLPDAGWSIDPVRVDWYLAGDGTARLYCGQCASETNVIGKWRAWPYADPAFDHDHCDRCKRLGPAAEQDRIPVDHDERAADVRSADNYELEADLL